MPDMGIAEKASKGRDWPILWMGKRDESPLEPILLVRVSDRGVKNMDLSKKLARVLG